MKNKVEGHNGLYKDNDPHSGVITNRNDSERRSYHIAKQQALANIEARDELAVVKDELKELSGVKEELDELKAMVKQLLNKNIT